MPTKKHEEIIKEKNTPKTLDLSQIVNIDHIKDSVEDAFYNRSDIMLWGKGGYAKSELVNACAIKYYKPEEVCYLQCGSGTTMEDFLGGINLKKLKDLENPTVEYYLDNSIFAKKLVVLEEVLDCDPRVLLFLKNTLTSRRVELGQQSYPIKTEQFVFITNWNPVDFAHKGNAFAALIDRFKCYTLEVGWESHDYDDYMKMLNSMEFENPSVNNYIKQTLAAWVAEKFLSDKKPISPRSVVKAVKRLQDRARFKQRDTVSFDDFDCFKFVDEFKSTHGSKNGLTDFAIKKKPEYEAYVKNEELLSKTREVVEWAESNFQNIPDNVKQERLLIINKMQKEFEKVTFENDQYTEQAELIDRIKKIIKKYS